ncbi:PREDICTED: uncharacterized protein LOC109479139 [Branchiostoma belcheri]|uniref:Uncharacterized protein LOC109479139 n=1 Tax=Branchiostoma belcheri TaxID=7741 RepID=A0A6P5A487_BRABE|nr:PREDICTED: uncharacterized protein LOC109479139 [Branchiostoma belcheri]
MSKLLGSLNEKRRLKHAISLEQQIAKEKQDSFWDLTDILTREQELKNEVLNSKLKRQTFALKEESRRLEHLMIVGHRLEQEKDDDLDSQTTTNSTTVTQNGRHKLTVSNLSVYWQDQDGESGGISPGPVRRVYHWFQRFVYVPVREKLDQLKTSFLEIINNRSTVKRSTTAITRELKTR